MLDHVNGRKEITIGNPPLMSCSMFLLCLHEEEKKMKILAYHFFSVCFLLFF